ncbi:GNAT family N-acetyltransferase [Kineosporia succinea]|uniref:GNAT superfamily N-acetyltransferase n=1 Tax=Kineosporia succinea TaxID=84632 RepID=A0ABT9PFX7_9ACTN|nr:GNAT superfamily N-acetyltransferase [Kineosporia succinea]
MADVDDVLALWSRSTEELSRPARAVAPPVSAASRLGEAIGGGELEVVLARSGDRPVGFLVMRESPLNVLTGSTALCVDEFWVAPSERRHGVARAMLAHVAGHAERLGVEQVIAGVPTAAKDTQRWFARLGFAPVTVRRAVTPSALRRRLSGADGQRGALEHLLSRRRSLRARARRQSESIGA